VIIYY
jgi:superfamily II DNA helicase RecQ